MPRWVWIIPLLALLMLGVAAVLPAHPLAALPLFVALLGAVIAGVHHAEVVAHRVGEPFGTLVLALAITVIQASLVVSLMLAGGEAAAELARNTLFATIMIICNGVVGLCLLLGATRYGEQEFRVQGVARVYYQHLRRHVLCSAAGIRRARLPGPLWNVCVCADDKAPRLLSSAGGRRDCRSARDRHARAAP